VRCSQPEGKAVDKVVFFFLFFPLSGAEAEAEKRIEEEIDERNRSGMRDCGRGMGCGSWRWWKKVRGQGRKKERARRELI
jgi:hypothetical protein